jgi:hypothetical protein
MPNWILLFLILMIFILDSYIMWNSWAHDLREAEKKLIYLRMFAYQYYAALEKTCLKF